MLVILVSYVLFCFHRFLLVYFVPWMPYCVNTNTSYYRNHKLIFHKWKQSLFTIQSRLFSSYSLSYCYSFMALQRWLKVFEQVVTTWKMPVKWFLISRADKSSIFQLVSHANHVEGSGGSVVKDLGDWMEELKSATARCLTWPFSLNVSVISRLNCKLCWIKLSSELMNVNGLFDTVWSICVIKLCNWSLINAFH